MATICSTIDPTVHPGAGWPPFRRTARPEANVSMIPGTVPLQDRNPQGCGSPTRCALAEERCYP
jgi:ABC-type antimicrobial peptide transport system ATPase subunit